jgi:chromate transporter
MERYVEIVKYFLKLGFTAFGGPAAHISMMENDLVKEKKWMSSQEFLDYIGITNLIPGPNSTEVTMHCGYHRGGIPGLFFAGISFIFPAVLLTGIIAYFFYKYEDLSLIVNITQGFKLIVLLIIAQASYRLFGKAAKSNYLIGLSIVSGIMYSFLPNEILLLLAVVLLSIGKYYTTEKGLLSIFPIFYFFSDSSEQIISNSKIFFSFLKIGSILFGSGYVLFAFLDTMFIEEMGILTSNELLDAIAIGQFTPGPILSTSTFIGYKLNGWSGAVMATIGIFLPSFIFVMITSPLVSRIRKNKMLGEVLDGVNAVSLAFIIVVTIKMAFNTISDWQSALVLAIGILLFFKLRLSPVFTLFLGGIMYAILKFF